MLPINIPSVSGIIRRRVLVNFRADPVVIQSKLPPPFRPKLHNDHAIVGICLIRLENIKPVTLGALPLGLASESAAHRIAVLWDDENGQTQEGVFIPRRDTNSLMNHLVGGRLFPGQHHLASFHVRSTETDLDFHMQSRDGNVEIKVAGTTQPELPTASCFASLAEASSFFEGGSLGYSVRHDSPRLDGLRLETKSWQVEALELSQVHSSYYADAAQFPKSSVVFDHALLMRNIAHEWHTAKEPTNR